MKRYVALLRQCRASPLPPGCRPHPEHCGLCCRHQRAAAPAQLPHRTQRPHLERGGWWPAGHVGPWALCLLHDACLGCARCWGSLAHTPCLLAAVECSWLSRRQQCKRWSPHLQVLGLVLQPVTITTISTLQNRTQTHTQTINPRPRQTELSSTHAAPQVACSSAFPFLFLPQDLMARDNRGREVRCALPETLLINPIPRQCGQPGRPALLQAAGPGASSDLLVCLSTHMPFPL